MKKILFISKGQYGYNTDLQKYIEYLTDEYQVTLINVNKDLPKINNNNAEIIYFQKSKAKFLTRLRLIVKSVFYIYSTKPDYIFIKYFLGCSFLRLSCLRKKIIVDIRTATIGDNMRKRRFRDMFLSFETNIFKHISIISEGLIEKLRLNKKKTYVLPLGADRIVEEPNQSERRRMDVLYIGILDYRNIHETIEGFREFYIQHKSEIPCRYTIIGFADNKEYEEAITSTIEKYGLNDVVSFVGRKKYEELGPFLESHNIGVSYVPITEYFQHQPPTKTYEYIQNGLVCIATNTFENRKVINESNGILIKEGAMEFYKGLEHIYQNLDKYDSRKISESAAKYSWKNIVDNILKPYINRL